MKRGVREFGRMCVTCGHAFLAYRQHTLDCSPRCQSRAWRYRHALLGDMPSPLTPKHRGKEERTMAKSNDSTTKQPGKPPRADAKKYGK